MIGTWLRNKFKNLKRHKSEQATNTIVVTIGDSKLNIHSTITIDPAWCVLETKEFPEFNQVLTPIFKIDSIGKLDQRWWPDLSFVLVYVTEINTRTEYTLLLALTNNQLKEVYWFSCIEETPVSTKEYEKQFETLSDMADFCLEQSNGTVQHYTDVWESIIQFDESIITESGDYYEYVNEYKLFEHKVNQSFVLAGFETKMDVQQIQRVTYIGLPVPSSDVKITYF